MTVAQDRTSSAVVVRKSSSEAPTGGMILDMFFGKWELKSQKVQTPLESEESMVLYLHQNLELQSGCLLIHWVDGELILICNPENFKTTIGLAAWDLMRFGHAGLAGKKKGAQESIACFFAHFFCQLFCKNVYYIQLVHVRSTDRHTGTK